MPSKLRIALDFDNLMSLICSSSHTRCAINRSMNEYPVAPVSNKAVVFILLLLPSIHEVTKDSSAKKSPGKDDDDTINGFSPLLTTSAEVRRFPTAVHVLLPLPCGSLQASSLASILSNIPRSCDLSPCT